MHPQRIRSSDLWSGVIFVGIGLVFFTQSLSLKLGSALHMGPGYMPLVLSGLLISVGLVLIVRSFWTLETVESTRILSTAPILLATLFFGAVIESGGFILATAGTMALAAMSAGTSQSIWKTALLIATCTAMAVVGVQMLGLPFTLLPSTH